MKLDEPQHITSEQRLIGEVKRGNRIAMRQLYDEYSGYAMSVGLRYVPDRNDGSLRSWIARIVANEALGLLRQRNRIHFTDKFPEEPDDDEPDLTRISDDALNALIGRLPDGYRVVLNLYVFGEMSHKEIAAQLGISPSTSASQFFHAKKMLARMITEYNKTQR